MTDGAHGTDGTNGTGGTGGTGGTDGAALRGRLEHRLGELQAEYRAGQEMLAALDAQRTDLQQTMLRIGGAVQVLGELLGAGPATPPVPGGPPRA